MNVDTITQEQQDQLDRLLAALPREIDPPLDLWPGIAARIDADQRTLPRLAQALAASVVIALGSALGGAWLGYGAGQRGEAASADTLAGVQGVEHSYAAARASYMSALTLSGTYLDEATRTTLRQNLAVIDAAAMALNAALREDPDNPIYMDALLMTREREMEMLADITRYSTTGL